MFFSIIIPIYKVEQYLSSCVESVLRQSFHDFECVLVDDGSPDRCPEMCDRFSRRDKRVSVIHKPNGGLSSARNAGIKAASGDYLLFIDSDDFWSDPFFLERIADSIKSAPADVLGFGLKKIYESKRCKKRRISASINTLPEEERAQNMIVNGQMYCSACLHAVRRNWLIENKLLFKESFQTGEDIEWTFRVLAHCPVIKVLNSTQYIYRVRENSICTSTYRTRQWESRYNALIEGKKAAENCGEPDYRNAILAYAAYQYVLLIEELSRDPDRKSRKEGYKRSENLIGLCEYALDPDRKSRKEGYKRSENLIGLCEYALDRKARWGSVLIKALGIPTASYILRLRHIVPLEKLTEAAK